MFKQITTFKAIGLPATAAELASHLERCRFVPCGPTQQHASGWVAPRCEHGAFVESIGGHWIAKLAIESKSVPTDALNKAVEKAAADIEAQTGRKPDKKVRRELKDRALIDLLPAAFPKRAEVFVLFDPEADLMIVGTASATKADKVAAELLRALPDFTGVSRVITKQSAAGAMTSWVASHDAGDEFRIGRDCELRAQDETKAIAKFTREGLDSADVRAHVGAGKVAKYLALTWRDRVSFVLRDDLTLTRVAILDVVFGGDGSGRSEDAFDADVTIAAAELFPMLGYLFEALGGVLELAEGGAV